jgi:uncharacterized membrane protein HdeD (DUF308 family)
MGAQPKRCLHGRRTGLDHSNPSSLRPDPSGNVRRVEAFAVFKWFYLVFGLWFLLSGVANLISAYCLKARKGRTFSLAVACLNLLHMPLGTLLGVFTLIVLLRDSVREAYEAAGSFGAAPPPPAPVSPMATPAASAFVSEPPPPVSPPLPPMVTATAAENRGDATGGIIPYKNPHALAAYYLGVFSIIPVFGFFLGVAAIPLGISGLRQKRRNPVIRGGVHAWIGIVGGSLSVLLHLLLVAIPVVAALTRHH